MVLFPVRGCRVQAEGCGGSDISVRGIQSRSGRAGIAIVPGGVCGDAPRDLQCSPIGGLETLLLVITYRRGVSYRVQKMIADIARELGGANLAIAS